MTAAQHEIKILLRQGGGLIRRRDHPELASALDWLVGLGRLRAVLPGVYLDPASESIDLRIRAVAAWEPGAVLTGRAAARISFWPTVPIAVVTAAVADRKAVRPGFGFSKRRIPPDLVDERNGLRHTSPALTALDLSITELGGHAIDTVLRTRAATLDQLRAALALSRCRRGNTDRRTLLLDSRDRPWSEAERDLHRLLRAAGIAGWRGNWGLDLERGTYWIDVAFPELKLAIEVDGWEFHRTRAMFEGDRIRQNDLVLRGWTVLRFTAAMIRDHPEVVVRQIEEAISSASR